MQIDAVLFAAGRGERLRPLTDRVPKPAVPILDVPLGAWGLSALLRASGRVLVNVSHLATEAAAALAPYAPEGALEILVEPNEPFGTGGTLRAVARRLSDEVAVWNGDLIPGVDVGALRDFHRASGRPATVAVRRVERGADLIIEGDRGVAFVDRRLDPDTSGVQFLGVAILSPGARSMIPPEDAQGLGGSVIAPLAGAGKLSVMMHDGYAIDVGTPARYLQASLDVLEGRAPIAPAGSPGEVVEVDGGRAYVGPGVSASSSSIGPGAILLSGAVVAEGCRVERSVVWSGDTVTTDLRDAVWCGRAIDASAPPRK
ncbi:MAG: NDP-sugar synthase [Actinomycetota bacterium]